MEDILIQDYPAYREDEILALYDSVGWTAYTERPAMLRQAIERSLCVLAAYQDGTLVGLARAVGDGVSIVYVQDILVSPPYQRRGIGSALCGSLSAGADDRRHAAYRRLLPGHGPEQDGTAGLLRLCAPVLLSGANFRIGHCPGAKTGV